MSIGKINPESVSTESLAVRLAMAGGFDSIPPQLPPGQLALVRPISYIGLELLRADLDKYFRYKRPVEHVADLIGVDTQRYLGIISGRSPIEPNEADLFGEFLGRENPHDYLEGIPALVQQKDEIGSDINASRARIGNPALEPG